MKYKEYVKNPDVTIYKGFRVTKDTNIEAKTKTGKQTIKDLIYTWENKEEKENCTIETKITTKLEEGALVLKIDDEFVVPTEPLETIKEAIEDYKSMKE